MYSHTHAHTPSYLLNPASQYVNPSLNFNLRCCSTDPNGAGPWGVDINAVSVVNLVSAS